MVFEVTTRTGAAIQNAINGAAQFHLGFSVREVALAGKAGVHVLCGEGRFARGHRNVVMLSCRETPRLRVVVPFFALSALGCATRHTTAERTIARPPDRTPIANLDTMVPIASSEWSGPRGLDVSPWEFRIARLDAESVCINVLQRTVVDDYDARIPWSQLRGTIDFEGDAESVRVRNGNTEAGPAGQEVHAGRALRRVQSGLETYCASSGCRTEPTFRRVAQPGTVLVNTAQQQYCFPTAELTAAHNAIVFYLDRIPSGSHGIASQRRTVRWVFDMPLRLDSVGGEIAVPTDHPPQASDTMASR